MSFFSTSPLRRVASALRSIAPLLFALAAAPIHWTDAQTKPMTITALNGLAYVEYDPDAGTTAYNVNFTVKNTGSATAALYVTRNCAAFCGLSGVWSGVWTTLSPGQSATVPVPLIVQGDDDQSSSIITLSAWAQIGGTLQSPPDIARVLVDMEVRTATLLPPAPPPIAWYQPSVTPKGGTAVLPRLTTATRAFTVQNIGSVQAPYTLSATCGTMSGCTVTPSTIILDPNATGTVNVTFATPAAAGTSNVVALTARYTNANTETVADQGTLTVVTPTAFPAVFPRGGAASVAVGGTGAATFSVSNTGTTSATFHLVPVCEGWSSACAVSSSDVTVNAGSTQSVGLSYGAPSSVSGPGAVVRLIAQLVAGGQVAAADTGWIPTALASYKPAIAPKTATVAEAAGTFHSAGFTVTNAGNVTATYNASISCPAVLGCINWNTTPITLPPGGIGSLTYGYYTPPAGQTATLQAIVTHSGGAPELTEADTARRTSTGGDIYAPTIVFNSGPNEGYTIATAAQSIVVSANDVDGALGTPMATLNGVPVFTTFTTSSAQGTGNTKTGTFALVAQPGVNTFVVTASDGTHTTTSTRHFTYDDSPEHQPTVAATRATDITAGGRTWADTFSVRNPGPLTTAYALTAQCSGAATSCAPSQPIISVASGQTQKVWVAYTTATSGTTGVVQLSATHTSPTNDVVSANAVTALTLDQIAPAAAIISPTAAATLPAYPTIVVQWCDADGSLAGHDVRIDGTPLTDVFVSQTRAGCVSAGTSTWTSFAVALGTHTISAMVTDVVGHSVTSSSTFSFALPPIANFQPRVTSTAATLTVIPNSATVAFLVRNAGVASATYQLTPNCGAFGTCSVDKPTVTLAAGASDSAHVTVAVPNQPLATGTVSLAASYRDAASRMVADTGRTAAAVPTAATLYQPVMTQPSPASWIVAPTSSAAALDYFGFPLRNSGLVRTTYSITASLTNGYGLAPGLLPTTITLDPGESTWLPVNVLIPSGNRATSDIGISASYVAAGGAMVSASAHAFIVPAVVTYGLVVAPKNQTRTVTQANTSIDFAAQATGNTAFATTGTISCTGFVVSCRGPGNTTYATVNATLAGQSYPIGFTVDTTRGRTGTVTLSLAGGGIGTTVVDSATVRIVWGGPFAAVAVSPHVVQPAVRPGVDVVQRFDITNIGTLPSRFLYTVTCSSASVCAPKADSTAVLDTAQRQSVSVMYHTGSTGSSGSVSLIAAPRSGGLRDTGIVAFTVENIAPVVVRAAAVNPGTTVPRDQCVAIGAGSDAAYECGDLRVAHALPATMTMNKLRAPTLVYNSGQTRGRGVVRADVSVAPGTYPATLRATLSFGVGKSVSRDIPWPDSLSTGTPKRVAIPYDAVNLSLTTTANPAGIFKYTLELRSTSDTALVGSDTGSVAIVDRSTSAFGQGWWLDGLEQLSFVTAAASQRMWIGGDGSVRLYTQRSANIWTVFPAVDRPDTLELIGNSYRRHLSNGAYVEFDATGRHIATVNSLGHATTFAYTGSALNRIDLPIPAGSTAAHSYVFGYAQNRLATIDAPPSAAGARRVTIGRLQGGAPIVSIADPGLPAVLFGVDGSGAIISRRNRLGQAAHFGYDTVSHLLVADTLDLLPTDGAPLVATFCPSEATGLAGCAPTPRDTSVVKTHYVGPRYDRKDSVDFYLTRYGAPRKIVDAIGRATRIERNDILWPLLATAVVDPIGHRIETTYDPLRALTQSTTDVNRFAVTAGDPSATATTTYQWDATCDEVTLITAPTLETQRFTYDHPHCTRHSQQDARGDSTAVTFVYDALFRLRDIIRPNTAHGGTQHYDYDATLGNLSLGRSALGITSTIQRDVAGLDTLSWQPIDSLGARVTTRTLRDLAGRDTMTRTFGPIVTRGGDGRPLYSVTIVDSVVVRNWYNVESRLDSLTRHIAPNVNGMANLTTRWTYDAAGRKRTETSSNGFVERYVYADGVNLSTLMNRNGEIVDLRYDPLNRLVAKTLPSKSVTGSAGTIAIPGQTDSLVYDPGGRLTQAINSFAAITREYTVGGLMTRELQRVAAADGTLGLHDYDIRYDYDLVGRRRHVFYPAQLARSPQTASLGYSYNEFGALGSITLGVSTEAFTYLYDARQRVAKVTAPNGIADIRRYDDDDRVTSVIQRAPALGLGWYGDVRRAATDTIRSDAVQYDLTGKATHVETYDGDVLDMGYNAVGPLSYSFRWNPYPDLVGRRLEETFAVDALGNVKTTVSSHASIGSDDLRTYEASTGRLMSIVPQHGTSASGFAASYDNAGNQVAIGRSRTAARATSPAANFVLFTNTQNLYDAAGHLRVVRQRPDVVANGGIHALQPDEYSDEETRYDALGRRIWVQSNHVASASDCSVWCSVQRFVWDGDQLLGEFRMPVGAETAENDLETIVTREPVPDSTGGFPLIGGEYRNTYSWRWGTVTYAHGAGMDHPIAITRSGGGPDHDTLLVPPLTMYPMLDWRGNVASVSFAGGRPLSDGSIRGTPPLPTEQNAELSSYGERTSGTSWAVSSWVGSLISGQFGESGLQYRRNRYYDPQQGRFTQEDPIGLAGGMNLYGFAGGDPVNFSDPLGLCPTLADGSEDPDCLAREKKVRTLTESVRRRINQWNAAVRDGMTGDRDHTSSTHLNGNLFEERNALSKQLGLLEKCDDDDDFPGTKAEASAVLRMPILQGPGRYPDKSRIPPRFAPADVLSHVDPNKAGQIVAGGLGGVLLWMWILAPK